MYTKKSEYKYMVIALAMTIFFSCQTDFKEVQQLGVLDSGPLSISENINTKYTDSGKLKSHLQSAKMLNFSNRDFGFYEFPIGANLTLYDDSNNKSNVISDYAIMFDKTQLIDLRGNVVLHTHNNDTLFADQLYYDQERQWLFTNQPVKFRTKDQIINGNGFDSNRNFTNAQVLEVTGIVYLNE